MTEITREIIGVGDLNRTIADVLDRHIGNVWVRGEISNFKAYDSGHWYFSLKDAEGQIRCVMFRGRNAQVGFLPKEGDLVEVAANVGMYVPRGDLQLNVGMLRRAGQGGLYEAFLKLKEKLSAEGLFDESKKRSLPKHPKGIAVVTSAQAAALKDVLTTLGRRAPHIPVTIYPTLVQGVDAPPAIKNALEAAYEAANRGEVEVILLVRGGGSIEDLWAFNDESLARVIAQAPVPLVSGVGHETDFTIADFVADLRAPTPTGAAELATPDRQALLQDLEVLAQRMTVRVTQRLDREAQRLDQLSLRLSHALPNPDRMREKAEQLKARLDQAWQVRVNVYQQQHLSWNSHLELLNPQRTLDRGYAVLLDAEGQALRDPGALKAGKLLEVHLAQGGRQVELAKVDSLAKNASSE
ncbi:exodeoxyribonuclease VII large subunit [Polynucleobacter sp. 30F-ANTBAC]|jgi:exodeoxyribonuclease VII large subunit|uniref:exodeoxyribonuclease VII large subunit n=1 Tax=Polynucleobacter sp. 30F-ANTBAC TaxID=2689095 RepID=UPI001C0D43D2|nr:exodeoxyribonuclease VII large subunit [Polynucleobacter sp. 30F-ANTBAC]MBU3599587.1 exodeoxyribonuclease VII large subunit [Polynucleobacter sp. 30F-ANTBAC]